MNKGITLIYDFVQINNHNISLESTLQTMSITISINKYMVLVRDLSNKFERFKITRCWNKFPDIWFHF